MFKCALRAFSLILSFDVTLMFLWFCIKAVIASRHEHRWNTYNKVLKKGKIVSKDVQYIITCAIFFLSSEKWWKILIYFSFNIDLILVNCKRFSKNAKWICVRPRVGPVDANNLRIPFFHRSFWSCNANNAMHNFHLIYVILCLC